MSSLSFEGEEIVERLPGERSRGPLSPLSLLLRLLLLLVCAGLAVAIGLLLWPLYGLGVCAWGRAPHVPRLEQAWRYLGYVWRLRAKGWSMPALHRAYLSVEILRRMGNAPRQGLAWQLDELLYGRELDAAQVVAPLLEISAARSGSTQLARYLERDPELVAPTLAQMLFPCLWLWKLVAATLGRVITPEQAAARARAMVPPEFLERHEGDLFGTDTFEAAFYTNKLNGLSVFLGPRVFQDEFSLGEIAPWNRELWEQDFVALLDRVARKALLWHGVGRAAGRQRRVFVKGHFLGVADALARRYPDARFLTMIRHPSPRLRSAINFMRVNPILPELGEPRWATVAPALAETEAAYCEREQAWFDRQGVVRRCVVRFDDYVRDLEGAMAKIYRECLDQEQLPEHVPREHEPRERTNYTVNRTLAQVCVDQAAFEARLAEYIEWCEGPAR